MSWVENTTSETFIIAEAGVNHNGDLDKALALVDVAVEAGADAIKFQTFKAEALVTQSAQKADYQKHNTGNDSSQFDMLKQLELPHEHHFRIKDYCEQKRIEFMSTAFDFESLAFLLSKMDLQRLKIPSGELTNDPLVFAHAQSGLPLIVSTGMATISEIEHALMVICGGLLSHAGIVHQEGGLSQKGELPQKSAPEAHDWQRYYTDAKGRELLMQRAAILQCVTEYPAPPESLNLRAINTLHHTFGLPVGLSDHSLGTWAALGAVSLGARIIEKHITLDKSLPGPDHKASLAPHELVQMVREIRQLEQALGDGIKRPLPCEIPNRAVARKSLVITSPIKAGEVLSAQHVGIKRPEGGMPPSKYWHVLGKVARKDLSVGALLDENSLEE